MRPAGDREDPRLCRRSCRAAGDEEREGRGQGCPAPRTPRQSASLILLRDGERAVELLLVRRNPAARFMGGYWVFPGGAVDAGEDHRTAAVRELAEEAAVTNIEPESLVAYSRWITPERI